MAQCQLLQRLLFALCTGQQSSWINPGERAISLLSLDPPLSCPSPRKSCWVCVFVISAGLGCDPQ